MNDVSVKNFINGRPTLSETTNHPLRLFKFTFYDRLTQFANNILDKIVSIFRKILPNSISQVIFVSSLEPANLVALFDQNSPKQHLDNTVTNPSAVYDYFKKFLCGAGCPKKFKGIFNSIQGQMQSIFLRSLMKNKILSEETAQQLLNTVSKLKNGNEAVVVANSNPNDMMFLHISKENGAYTLKFIGRGSSMKSISQVDEVCIAGKVKIPSAVVFSNIPERLFNNKAWLKAFLAQTDAAGQFDIQSLNNLTKHLSEYREPVSGTALAKLTNNATKNFWSLMKQIRREPVTHSSYKAEEKHLYLKMELDALKKVLDQFNNSPIADSENALHLERMIHFLSQDALLAFKKGYIIQDDLRELVKILSNADAALRKVKQAVIPPLKTLIVLSESSHLTTQDLLLGERTQVDFPSKPQLEEPPREPSNASFELENVSLDSFFMKRCTKQGMFNVLDAQVQQPNEGLLYDILNTIKFDAFTYANVLGMESYKVNPSSLWHQLTQEEAVRLMEHLNTLSEWLANKMLSDEKPSIESHEMLHKMSMLVLFLNTKYFTTNTSNNTAETLRTIIRKFFQAPEHFVFTTTILDFIERTCFRINPKNMDLFKEVESTDGIKINKEQTLSAEQGKENFKYIDNQLSCLHKVYAYLKNYTSPGMYFLPKNMNSLMRPLKHPFLISVYRNVLLQQDQRTSENHSTSSFKSKVFETKCLKTQEAIVDDPEQVADHFTKYLEETITECNLHFAEGNNKEPALKHVKRDFTKEEMTAILLMTRKQTPQTEIIGFMSKQRHLLAEPEIRNFVDHLLFHPSLLRTLYFKKAFREDLCNKLLGLIEDFSNAVVNKENRVNELLYLMEVYQKLQRIYQGNGYPIKTLDSEKIVSALLNTFSKNSNGNYNVELHGILTMHLKLTLEKNTLTPKEVESVIKCFMYRKQLPTDPLNIDPSVEFFIEHKYLQLLDNAIKDVTTYAPVLDRICSFLKLPLDQSHWQGTFPTFSNGLYELNLATGEVVDLLQRNQLAKLPDCLYGNPHFCLTFKDISLNTLQPYLIPKENGHSVYLFKDAQSHICQIEEQNGTFRFFRHFAFNPKPLQSVDIESILSEKQKAIPFIFNRAFYMDPADPKVGYSVDSSGKLLFKVAFDIDANQKLTIRSIIDCRGEVESAPLQVMNANNIDHPILQAIGRLEDLSQTMIWMQNGRIISLELPRYGLTFAYESGKLTCLHPSLKGYEIDLKATLAERLSMPFSIKLVHPNPELSPQLLFPAASVLNVVVQKGEGASQWKIQSNDDSLVFHSLGMVQHTHALNQSSKASLRPMLELVKQAMLVGNYEQAKQLLDSIKLAEKDLTKDIKKGLSEFIRKFLLRNGLEASIKIQFALSCMALTKGKKLHEGFRKGLKSLIAEYLKSYLQHGRKLSSSLLLTQQDFTTAAKYLKQKEPEYFSKHLFPFFLQDGKLFKLPVQVAKVAAKGDEKPIENNWIDEMSRIHCKKKLIYSLNKFNPHYGNSEQLMKYFLPLYREILTQPVDSESFQEIKWHLELYAVNNLQQLTVHLHAFLKTVVEAREKGIDVSKLPTAPEIEKKESYESSYEFEKPIKDFIIALDRKIPAIKQQLPPPAPPFVVPAVQPYSDEDTLAEKYKVVKAERSAQQKNSSIEDLEKVIQPHVPLTEAELSKTFTYVSNGPQLLFTAGEINSFFDAKQEDLPHFELPKHAENASTCEKSGLKELKEHLADYAKANPQQTQRKIKKGATQKLLRKVKTKQHAITTSKKQAKDAIDSLIHTTTDPIEKLSILGLDKRIADDHELLLAFMQNDLQGLKDKGLLPLSADLVALKQALINYYDLLLKEELCITLGTQLKKLKVDQYGEEINTFYQLLTRTQNFKPEENPELLGYQVMALVTFRKMKNGKNQLELLQKLLSDPASIIQAPTGVGKTIVLSILRALMKPNGKNLVTQRIMPALLKQTVDQMQQLLGDIFNKKIYVLQFDLKRPLVFKETVYEENKETGKKEAVDVQSSLFKSIYHNMLKVTEEKGCLVTDYKSMPLLEETFFKISRELLAIQGTEYPALTLEHWHYLRKILILLGNKEETLMDELDRPNRPINRIQTQLQRDSKKPAKFFVDESINIYRELLKQEHLRLKENLQGDIPESARAKSIQNVARTFAQSFAKNGASADAVYDYFLGNDERVLQEIETWLPEEKDVLSFYKDQFSTYLKLTLSYSGKSRYKRSEDGKRTVPCDKGSATTAKFGGIHEEINYAIQDYVQNGVSAFDLSEWIAAEKKELHAGRSGAQQRFEDIFPGKKLSEVSAYAIEDLIREVNANPKLVEWFLIRRLENLTVSGAVATMNPQNIAGMSRAVSGVSATIGSTDIYHENFRIDKKAAGAVRAEMIYRYASKFEGPRLLQEYDPENPLQSLAAFQGDAIIDGAGALKDSEPKNVAAAMLDGNQKLNEIGFHRADNTLTKITRDSGDRAGFYFSQEYTRGTNRPLNDDAVFIHTINTQGTLDELSQEEGRSRLEGQKIVPVRSKYSPELRTLSDVVQHKDRYQSRKQAEEVFSSAKQKLNNVLYKNGKQKLLSLEDIESFLNEFGKLKHLFINPEAPNYNVPGSYFERNKHIRKKTEKPENVLETLRTRLVNESKELDLQDAIPDLNNLQFPIDRMPEKVFSIDQELDAGLEVELEEDVEEECELGNEVENELEMDLENEKEVEHVVQGMRAPAFYLPRVMNGIAHSLKTTIHPAYDSRLHFTDPFLPLTRRDPLYKRKAFDNKMFRVGVVHFSADMATNSITLAQIGDLIDDSYDQFNTFGFYYDLRSGTINHLSGYGFMSLANANGIKATPEFQRLTAQCKFFDGWINDYSDEEIAQLKLWLELNGRKELRRHFEAEVLSNRPEVKMVYKHSQVWKLLTE